VLFVRRFLVLPLTTLTFLVSGCVSSGNKEWNSPYILHESERALAGPTPCDDPLYLELTVKPIKDITDREFAYFLAKDAACQQWQSDAANTEEVKESIDRLSMTWILCIVVGVLGVSAAASNSD